MHGQDFLGGPSVCEALSRSHAVEKEDVDRIYRMKRINLRTRKQTPNGEPLFLISFRFPSCKSRKSCQNPSSLTASFRLRACFENSMGSLAAGGLAGFVAPQSKIHEGYSPSSRHPPRR